MPFLWAAQIDINGFQPVQVRVAELLYGSSGWTHDIRVVAADLDDKWVIFSTGLQHLLQVPANMRNVSGSS